MLLHRIASRACLHSKGLASLRRGFTAASPQLPGVLPSKLPGKPTDEVRISRGTHELKYIERVEGPITEVKEVPALILENNKGMSLKVSQRHAPWLLHNHKWPS